MVPLAERMDCPVGRVAERMGCSGVPVVPMAELAERMGCSVVPLVPVADSMHWPEVAYNRAARMGSSRPSAGAELGLGMVGHSSAEAIEEPRASAPELRHGKHSQAVAWVDPKAVADAVAAAGEVPMAVAVAWAESMAVDGAAAWAESMAVDGAAAWAESMAVDGAAAWAESRAVGATWGAESKVVAAAWELQVCGHSRTVEPVWERELDGRRREP